MAGNRCISDTRVSAINTNVNGLRAEWAAVSGPTSMVIATVHDVGWSMLSPWKLGIKQDWGNLQGDILSPTCLADRAGFTV